MQSLDGPDQTMWIAIVAAIVVLAVVVWVLSISSVYSIAKLEKMIAAIPAPSLASSGVWVTVDIIYNPESGNKRSGR